MPPTLLSILVALLLLLPACQRTSDSEACLDYCDNLLACDPTTHTDRIACGSDCSVRIRPAAGESRECATALGERVQCAALVTDCAELDAFIAHAASDPCASDYADVEAACGHPPP